MKYDFENILRSKIELTFTTTETTKRKAEEIIFLAERFPKQSSTLSACAIIILAVTLDQATTFILTQHIKHKLNVKSISIKNMNVLNYL